MKRKARLVADEPRAKSGLMVSSPVELKPVVSGAISELQNISGRQQVNIALVIHLQRNTTTTSHTGKRVFSNNEGKTGFIR
jgi:hypothetical protein